MQHLFNSKVDILRVTRVSDGMGSGTEVRAVLHKNLACRLNWSRGAERIMFDKETYFRDGKFYCNVVDITTNDRMRFGAVTYEIVSVSNVDEVGKYLIVEIRLVR